MKQKSLFAWEYFSQQDAEETLSAIEPLLAQIIMECWCDLEAYRLNDANFRHLTPAGMAQWLHFQIIGRVKAAFPPVGESDAGGWCFDPSGMFHLDYKFMQLTFKKLDQDFQRSNYPTAHNDGVLPKTWSRWYESLWRPLRLRRRR